MQMYLVNLIKSIIIIMISLDKDDKVLDVKYLIVLMKWTQNIIQLQK